MHKEVRILKSQIYNNKIVKYVVEYIMESGKRERERKHTIDYIVLRLIIIMDTDAFIYREASNLID
jgi:ribosomal protein S7